MKLLKNVYGGNLQLAERGAVNENKLLFVSARTVHDYRVNVIFEAMCRARVIILSITTYSQKKCIGIFGESSNGENWTSKKMFRFFFFYFGRIQYNVITISRHGVWGRADDMARRRPDEVDATRL